MTEHQLRERNDEERGITYLLVEHTIALVDVGDITLVLVVSLPREFALLVDAKQGNQYR